MYVTHRIVVVILFVFLIIISIDSNTTVLTEVTETYVNYIIT